MKGRFKIWIGLATLGAMAFCLAWSWQFTSPRQSPEPLSKTHFRKHRVQLEKLRILVKEDAQKMRMDIYVNQDHAQTENKLPLPDERVERYRALLWETNLDSIVCSEQGNRIWINNFDQTSEYAYFQKRPTRYDYQRGRCEHLEGHWYLYFPTP